MSALSTAMDVRNRCLLNTLLNMLIAACRVWLGKLVFHSVESML